MYTSKRAQIMYRFSWLHKSFIIIKAFQSTLFFASQTTAKKRQKVLKSPLSYSPQWQLSHRSESSSFALACNGRAMGVQCAKRTKQQLRRPWPRWRRRNTCEECMRFYQCNRRRRTYRKYGNGGVSPTPLEGRRKGTTSTMTHKRIWWQACRTPKLNEIFDYSRKAAEARKNAAIGHHTFQMKGIR